MSGIALTAGRSVLADNERPGPTSFVWTVMLFLGMCYFILGHDWRVSTKEAEGFVDEASEMESQLAEGNNLWRATFLAMGAMGGVLALVPTGRRYRTDWGMALAIVLTIGWCAASIVWSIDPLLTLRRVVVLVCISMGAYGVAKHFTVRDICLFGVLFSSVAVLVGLLAEMALATWRPWTAEYRFAGTVHPNYQAVQLWTILLGGLVLWRLPRSRRGILLVLMVCAAVLLLLTKSRTAVGACLIGVVSLWLVGVSPRSKFLSLTAVVVGGGLVVMTLLWAGIDDADAFMKVALLGRDDDSGTLTGRLPLWQYVAQDIAGRPWGGYGYNSYWTEETLADVIAEFGWPAAHAHNAYLETTLNIGLIGVGLTIMTTLVGLTKSTWRMASPDGFPYAFTVGMIAFGAANACLESHMLVPFNLAPFLVGCTFMRIAFWESPPNQMEVIGRER